MGIGWEPIRMAGSTDRESGRLARGTGEAVEAAVEGQGHESSLAAAERSLAHQWSQEVSREQFAAALRALADALSQDRTFRFAVDHRFMIMRPEGTPSIEYQERENQRKALVMRFTWEA